MKKGLIFVVVVLFVVVVFITFVFFALTVAFINTANSVKCFCESRGYNDYDLEAVEWGVYNIACFDFVTGEEYRAVFSCNWLGKDCQVLKEQGDTK